MLSIWRIAPGEVGVRDLLLGLVAVALLAGVVLGRHTERVRRNYKDYGTAKTAVPKARQLAIAAFKVATTRILVWTAILSFIVLVWVNLPH
jgi:hypothetical protein